MVWLITTLLYLLCFLEYSRAINFMLLAYQDELGILGSKSMSSLPKDVSDKVFFYLYTRCKPKDNCEGKSIKQELILNDVGVLKASNYVPTHPTKVLIHGFLDNANKPMPQTIKDNILKQEEVNVILVDWGKIAIGINYNGISKQTFDVGVHVARLIDFLVKNGARLDNFHLIGHSLGAHIAGFAGASVKNGKVARITGLDPAKPGFDRVPYEKRLNTNSAKFIDCIHTCVGFLGLEEAICTADFYPNGGKNAQPGCPFIDFGRCSHIRSYEYFAESINPKHTFLTDSCPSLPVNNHSQCSRSTVKMGYYTPTSAKGIFYGVTNKRPPFAAMITED